MTASGAATRNLDVRTEPASRPSLRVGRHRTCFSRSPVSLRTAPTRGRVRDRLRPAARAAVGGCVEPRIFGEQRHGCLVDRRCGRRFRTARRCLTTGQLVAHRFRCGSGRAVRSSGSASDARSSSVSRSASRSALASCRTRVSLRGPHGPDGGGNRRRERTHQLRGGDGEPRPGDHAPGDVDHRARRLAEDGTHRAREGVRSGQCRPRCHRPRAPARDPPCRGSSRCGADRRRPRRPSVREQVPHYLAISASWRSELEAGRAEIRRCAASSSMRSADRLSGAP